MSLCVCGPSVVQITCGIAVMGAILSGAACRQAAEDVSPADARAEAEAWRLKHEADYRDSWVTIAGLHFLDAGTRSVGSAPSNDIVVEGAPAVLGRLTLEGDTVRLEPDPSADVRMKGQPITAPIALTDDIPGPADELTTGGVRMVIHQSGARKSLRVWNPEGRMAKDFLGFSWFEIQPEYRVVGRFIQDAQPRTLQVINTFGDLDEFTTEGIVEFTLQGRTLRLRAFTTRATRLYFVFKDESSGAETYGAARFLYADLRADGSAVLDFNQAYNPPCAFNPYTTCPIPLPENRLPVKVLAGEKAYPVHVALPGA
ncbi:MAG: DUF1684 domain-containing protein [Acidobacteria bacterium]|nr:DUF1684 domain-containing protein [Acidobacteriota bacterium]